MRIIGDTNIPFLSYRRIALTLSALVVAAGLVYEFVGPGLNLGIDFVGGTQVTLKFRDQPDLGHRADWVMVEHGLYHRRVVEVDQQRFALVRGELAGADASIVREHVRQRLSVCLMPVPGRVVDAILGDVFAQQLPVGRVVDRRGLPGLQGRLHPAALVDLPRRDQRDTDHDTDQDQAA